MSKKSLPIISLTAAALILSGCSTTTSKSDTAAPQPPASNTTIKAADYQAAKYEDLKSGGELRLSINEINPQMNAGHTDANASTSTIWYWYNPQIALFDESANWYANPDYIESVSAEVKDGKTVVTWNINPKATFNDGTPIDYRAFQGTFKVSNLSDNAFAPSDPDGYKDMESVERGKNDKQVIVTYKFQYPSWQKNFEFLIHPTATKDAQTFNEAYLKNPHPEWGAGPYKVENVDFEAGNITFTKNEKWWGKPGKLEKVTLRALEKDAEINAFLNDQLDAVNISDKERLAKVDTVDNINKYTAVQDRVTQLALNGKSEVFSDINVRKAFITAIDRPKLLEIVFNGLNYTEAPVGSSVLFPYQKGYQDNLGELGKYDLQKSAEYLEASGWKREGDYFQKDGKDLEVHIPQFSSNASATAVFGALQSMTKKAGIKLVIDTHKPKDFSAVIKGRQYDVLYSAIRKSNPFGIADIEQLYATTSTYNKSDLSNADVDKFAKQSVRANTEEEAIKYGNEAEKESFKLAGFLPLFNGPHSVATKSGLANYGATGFVSFPKELIGWTK
ncbi:hypothetical protein BSR29_06765 [Boudabousia liubingyangii]|uniref:Solute-binding protein family 5 domain-containing protein n=1 Tax=Boudabousia liubingyangii TaxID=1921764 RepID=A0A1Q5PKZ4_9ACTO|nr:ABC transporter family substrate-binding protein [Boudabousia liubingyangii]OKL47308.1 hypothetical protein BSR29_06765 [Boudabousia liubingyangii]